MLKYWRKFPEGEVDVYSEYKKNSASANNSDNPCNGKYPKKIQTEHGESIINIPCNRVDSLYIYSSLVITTQAYQPTPFYIVIYLSISGKCLAAFCMPGQNSPVRAGIADRIWDYGKQSASPYYYWVVIFGNGNTGLKKIHFVI
ncbi:hypothetical protein [Bacteroides fragilis]|uniref:hypothetical protein n=1 Tax=Bacteroides fragilis TaxID=817 RepID=UPI00202DCC3E|nr:hypothetical protein [Bacteroides fragilis]MCM0315192.1 hypothetical protein [Bacteroides fragilis]